MVQERAGVGRTEEGGSGEEPVEGFRQWGVLGGGEQRCGEGEERECEADSEAGLIGEPQHSEDGRRRDEAGGSSIEIEAEERGQGESERGFEGIKEQRVGDDAGAELPERGVEAGRRGIAPGGRDGA